MSSSDSSVPPADAGDSSRHDSPATAEGAPDAARELEAANDRALRAQAELENVRRRLQREMDESLRYANLLLLSDLLPVVDNLTRAIEACEKGGDLPGLASGVRMVSQQIAAVLEKHHCQTIDALDRPFDPGVHQAVAQQPVADRPANTVLAVAQAGYRLHDRVLRPAMVVVSTAAAAE